MNKNKINGFKCLRCSWCCSFSSDVDCPVLLPQEVHYLNEVAKHMGILNLNFEMLNNGFYKWIIKGYCSFYDRDNKSCKIHSEKPLACKIFPLLLNPTTMELLLSTSCKWVNDNKKLLEKLGRYIDQIFPSELEAVKELVNVIYLAMTKRLTYVLFKEIGKESLPRKLFDKCIKVDHVKSNIVKGLNLMLLSDCTKEDVEDVFKNHKFNGAIIVVDELRILIPIQGLEVASSRK